MGFWAELGRGGNRPPAARRRYLRCWLAQSFSGPPQTEAGQRLRCPAGSIPVTAQGGRSLLPHEDWFISLPSHWPPRREESSAQKRQRRQN
jgi:hypothetical protein